VIRGDVIFLKEGVLMQRKMVHLFISLLVILFFFDGDAFANVERNRVAFNEFKEIMSNCYIFKDYKNINWDNLYAKYENQILNSNTDDEFAYNLSLLVLEIKDSHFYVANSDGFVHPRYYPEWIKSNYNLDAIPRIVQDYREINSDISIGFVDNIGYLMIKAWSQSELTEKILPQLLQNELKDTDGLIIDERMNHGGWGSEFPSYFIDANSILYGHDDRYEYIDGKSVIITNQPLYLPDISHINENYKTGNNMVYKKPVIVLIGNHSVSAAEVFVLEMTQCHTVTTMGERTWGSVGAGAYILGDVDNSNLIPDGAYKLANNVTMSLPHRAIKDTNKKHIEDNGIEPDIYVPFISDGSDNVLIEAFRYFSVNIVDENEPEPDPEESVTPEEPVGPDIPDTPEAPTEPEEPLDPTTLPPAAPDNTVTITIPSPTNPGQQWTISITSEGGVPIPANVQFYYWFIPVNNSRTGGISVSDVPKDVGPFVEKSTINDTGATTLNVDVNNLIKPDGTKGSVPGGSYKIQFADSETRNTYVGTTETITVKGTSETSPSNNSGGCNTGYGIIGLLLMGIALRKYRTL
jgi:hypothetical protein